MKKIFTLSLLLILSQVLFAQAPLTFNYQGVARNASGIPYSNQEIYVKLTIRKESPSGQEEYAETRIVNTNSFGLFSIQVGSSGVIQVLGNISMVKWSEGLRFLQTEIKLPNQSSFTDLGATQILSAPYAINSLSANQLKFPFDTTVNESYGSNSAMRVRIKGGLNSRAFMGESDNGYGMLAISQNNHAVFGYSSGASKAGLYGTTLSSSGVGVFGESSGSGIGVRAKNTHANGLALAVEGKMQIMGNGQAPAQDKVLTSDASGNASWQYPKTIAFRASGLLNDVDQSIPYATYRKVLFNQSARYNEGNGYDAANAIFFPPVTGIYHLNTKVSWHGETTTAVIRIRLLRNGQITNLAEESQLSDGGTYFESSLALDIRLQQNDAIWVEVLQNNDDDVSLLISKDGYQTWFSGHLITRL